MKQFPYHAAWKLIKHWRAEGIKDYEHLNRASQIYPHSPRGLRVQKKVL